MITTPTTAAMIVGVTCYRKCYVCVAQVSFCQVGFSWHTAEHVCITASDVAPDRSVSGTVLSACMKNA